MASRSILEFFKPTKDSGDDRRLKSVPATVADLVEKEIRKTSEDLQRTATDATGTKRGNYAFVTAESKAKIAKYASENGVTASIRYFKRKGEFTSLKESTVRGWVSAYRSKLTVEPEITELSEKQRGRPLLIGKELESQVKRIIQELREANGTVNTAIVLATARGVILAKDANLLAENGGSIDLSKDWAKRLLSRMGYVKRKACNIKSHNFIYGVGKLEGAIS